LREVPFEKDAQASLIIQGRALPTASGRKATEMNIGYKGIHWKM
jgi:hypothetical protein